MQLKLVLFIYLIFSVTPLFAQNKVDNTIDSLEYFIEGALSFLEDNQEDSTIEGKQYAGEWPVSMQLTTTYIFIGRKQKVRDSNCFTVSAVHNFLSEMYLADTSLSQIKPMLRKAFLEIKTYETDEKFNFWKKLPPNKKLKLFNNPSPLPLVRRPTNYRLRSRFINNTANIPEDADDTSLGNLSKYYQNLIFDKNEKLTPAITFDQWQDSNRNNKQWYNYFFLQKEPAEAFLTWLHPEHEYKKWNPVKMGINTFFIFVPSSTARPKAYQPWVPFGANDVDIVVNSNILSYLAITKQLANSKVAPKSARFLNKLSELERYWDEAIYYPNSFHSFYALSRAYHYSAGITDITASKMAQDLSDLQTEDGSFQSTRYLDDGDPIQSTAYALHALLDLKEKGITIQDSSIRRAILFLLKNAHIEGANISWEGGVFFSGGTVLRNIMVWKSDAYTTALIARCLQKYSKSKVRNE